jgi:hypothetical protein
MESAISAWSAWMYINKHTQNVDTHIHAYMLIRCMNDAYLTFPN